MRFVNLTCGLMCAAVAGASALAVSAHGASPRFAPTVPEYPIVTNPLFESHEPLTLTIQAPFRTIVRDRSQSSTEHPGTISVELGGGSREMLDVKIRTRGNTRLRPSICDFPPLRLNFDRDLVENTLFADQDKLKLVTHCRDQSSEYEQYVLQEYLVYRIYNLLTELSFRVRLAQITYVDTDHERDSLTRYAFLIEPDEHVAYRNRLDLVHRRTIPPGLVDPVQLSLLEVFQYMIGNTDWSAFAHERNKDECCHNVLPIGKPDGWVIPVPHDFDIAGIITPRYADRLYGPNERFGISTVRERLYIGRCESEPYLEHASGLFAAKKEAIKTLYRNQPGLEETTVAEALQYIDEFYELILDPRNMTREFARSCRADMD